MPVWRALWLAVGREVEGTVDSVTCIHLKPTKPLIKLPKNRSHAAVPQLQLCIGTLRPFEPLGTGSKTLFWVAPTANLRKAEVG